jgi:hypothetical protein
VATGVQVGAIPSLAKTHAAAACDGPLELTAQRHLGLHCSAMRAELLHSQLRTVSGAPAARIASTALQRQGCVQLVEAALDGATALHCAALRGNPAQTDHLLYCKADPTLKTAAGLLPLELVPLCGDRDASGTRICRCMHAADVAVWECRSRVTREMLMQYMLSFFSSGAGAWLKTSLKVRARRRRRTRHARPPRVVQPAAPACRCASAGWASGA